MLSRWPDLQFSRETMCTGRRLYNKSFNKSLNLNTYLSRRFNNRENNRGHNQDNPWPTHTRLSQSARQPRKSSSNSSVKRHRPTRLRWAASWDSQTRCWRWLSPDGGRDTDRVKIWKWSRRESWGVYYRVLRRLVSTESIESLNRMNVDN